MIVIDGFYDGGAEMFAIRLANALTPTDTIFFLEVNPNKDRPNRQIKLLNSKITLFQLWLPELFKFFGYKLSAMTSINFISIIKKLYFTILLIVYKIDIINSHSWDSDSFVLQPAKLVGVNLAISFHGHYELVETLRENYGLITKNILKNTSCAIITNDNHLKTLKRFHFENKFYKVYYGLDFLEYPSITSFSEDEVLRLCIVSRAIKEKGWNQTINAVIQINAEFGKKRVELQLVGEGDQYNELFIKYQSYDFIIFSGYCENVITFIDNSHICLLPSTYSAESLPNSVIEYLSRNKPIIVTNIGEMPNMGMYNGQFAGKIIHIENLELNTEQVKDAIKYYIENPEMIKFHSVIASKAVMKFKMEECVSFYRHIFEIAK